MIFRKKTVLGMVAPCNHRPKRDFTSAKEYTMLSIPERSNLICDIEEQQLYWKTLPAPRICTKFSELLRQTRRGDVASDSTDPKNNNHETHLRMDEDANDLAITDHFLEVIIDGLLAQIVGPFLGSLWESLLLAWIPACPDKEMGKKEFRNCTSSIFHAKWMGGKWAEIISSLSWSPNSLKWGACMIKL